MKDLKTVYHEVRVERSKDEDLTLVSKEVLGRKGKNLLW